MAQDCFFLFSPDTNNYNLSMKFEPLCSVAWLMCLSAALLQYESQPCRWYDPNSFRKSQIWAASVQGLRAIYGLFVSHLSLNGMSVTMISQLLLSKKKLFSEHTLPKASGEKYKFYDNACTYLTARKEKKKEYSKSTVQGWVLSWYLYQLRTCILHN